MFEYDIGFGNWTLYNVPPPFSVTKSHSSGKVKQSHTRPCTAGPITPLHSPPANPWASFIKSQWVFVLLFFFHRPPSLFHSRPLFIWQRNSCLVQVVRLARQAGRRLRRARNTGLIVSPTNTHTHARTHACTVLLTDAQATRSHPLPPALKLWREIVSRRAESAASPWENTHHSPTPELLEI